VSDEVTMKSVFRLAAKVLAGIAGVVFFCPARLFGRDFSTGLLIQIGIAGISGLVAVVCWHFADA
jgi:hypothetical protein